MQLFKRLAVLLFAVGTTVASLAYLALASGLVPWYMVETYVKPLIGGIPLISAGIAALVWSVMLVLLFIGGQHSIDLEREVVVGGGEKGRVNIAHGVITGVAEKAAAKVNGVREAFAKIRAAESGENPSIALNVGLVISNGADKNAVELGEEARGLAEEAVKAMTGLERVIVEVHIVEVSAGMNRDAKAAKKRVV